MVTQSFLDDYHSFSVDSDGINEIDSLTLMDFEPEEAPPLHSRMVLVLVEDRLLQSQQGGYNVSHLTDRLERYKEDLWLDGFTSRFVTADVYSGPDHQDGRTVLAFRQLFREIWNRMSNFAGVVFVGSFPEPMLVRRWVWRRKNWRTTINGREYTQDYLRIVPETIAHRSDIVLSDMTGHWDRLYNEGPRSLKSIEVIPRSDWPTDWPTAGYLHKSDTFKVEEKQFEDFFFIDDSYYYISEQRSNHISLLAHPNRRNPEVGGNDDHRTNPISTPDIHVSRINPRHIADMPDPSFRDNNQRALLDSNGKPQAVTTSQDPNDQFVFDSNLERRLLIEYFDRNHAFRSGELEAKVPHRASAAGKDFSARRLLDYLEKDVSDFGSGFKTSEASLTDYVNFLKIPAVLKGAVAHANAWNSAWGDDYHPDALEQAVGGHPWRWKKMGNRYVPSFDDQGPHADLYLHRSLYHNNALNERNASLWIHMGCQVNSPGRSTREPYSHEGYGNFQNAEGILFYCQGLALLSRAKVFYDWPKNFSKALGERLTGRFGDGLTAYYDAEADSSSLADIDEVGACKRAYTWSVIGDWTLRLRYFDHEKDRDCLRHDPDQLRVEESRGRWFVMKGRFSLIMTPSEEEAQQIIDTVKRYDLTEQCFIGRPDSSMTYWLHDGHAPKGDMDGEDELHHNMYGYDVIERYGRILVTDGRSSMISCPNYREAAHCLYVLRHYRFDRRVFIGRPDASMSFFKSSTKGKDPKALKVNPTFRRFEPINVRPRPVLRSPLTFFRR